MPQRFEMEIPKEDLASFLSDLKSDPDMKLISQEKRGNNVLVVWENTAAPDLVEEAPASGAGAGSGASTGSTVAGTVGPFSNDDWNKYCNVLGNRESGNDYSIVNQLGFAGRWQFGCGALIDCGYVRPGTQGGGAPASASAWTGKDSVSSRQDWLKNESAQNSAMVVYTQSHYKSLLNKGAVAASSSKARVAGLLAAAHLMGVGGAIKMVNGTVTSDANGTTTTSYYKLLSEAFGGTGQLEP
jgi:hypothetical protein